MSAQTLKYVTPAPETDAKVLLEAFQDFSGQASFINWEPTPAKGKILKKPIQRTNDRDTHLTLGQALQESAKSPGKMGVGLVHNLSHSLISIDIDGVSSESYAPLKTLLSQYPTYTEQSPSGKPNHSRLVYSLFNMTDKAKLKGKAVTVVSPPKGEDTQIELFNSSRNYVTLTGIPIPGTPSTVSHISLSDLLDLFPEWGTKNNVIQLRPTKTDDLDSSPQSIATLAPINVWIQEVPLDRDDHKLQSFLSTNSMSYYEYWLTGIMALYDTFSVLDGARYAELWSRKAGTEYNQEELDQKWSSFDETSLREARITHKTYQWLFHSFNISWPKVTGKTSVPKDNEFENTKAFLAHRQMQVRSDAITLDFYLDGAEGSLSPRYYIDESERYGSRGLSKKGLITTLVGEMFEYGYTITPETLTRQVNSLMSMEREDEQEARFVKKINSLPPYDPSTEPDYINVIAERVLIRDEAFEAPSPKFYSLLVRKWLLSLGRTLWGPPQINLQNVATAEGMLIVSSMREGIGKSTFARLLFPPDFRDMLYIETQLRIGNYENKDYKLKTCTKLIVDYDEFDQIAEANNPSGVKSAITKRRDSFRAPYAADVEYFQRRYSAYASTNATATIIPKEGNRRYWWLNVKEIDTDLMMRMDMHNLWRQIKHSLETTKYKSSYDAPWLLTPKEVIELKGYLAGHSLENSVELLITEVFDFDEDIIRAQLVDLMDVDYLKSLAKRRNSTKAASFLATMSITDIQQAIIRSPKFSSHGLPTLAHVKRTVIELLRRHYPPVFELGVTTKAPIKYGIRSAGQNKRYLMPPLNPDSVFDQVTDDE